MLKQSILLISLCFLTACAAHFTPPSPVRWQDIEGELKPIQQEMIFPPAHKGDVQ